MACGWELLRHEAFIANPLCDLADNAELRPMLESSVLTPRNTTALLSSIRAGLGATVLPSSVLPDVGDDLVVLRPENPK